MTRTIAIAVLALLTPAAWAASPEPEEGSATGPPPGLTLDDMRTFTDAFNLIRNNYVEEIGDRALLEAAIAGMVASLDPYSDFLAPDAYGVLDDETRGRYGGIGVEVRFGDGAIEILEAVEGGPAAEAGMAAGDRIVAVDGTATDSRAPWRTMEALQGPPGTSVRVRWRRPGGQTRTRTLERAYVPLPSVAAEWRDDDDVLYLRITQFHRHTAEEMETDIRALRDARAAAPAGVVLDLRGNPGGVLGPAVAIADGFLDSGRITHTEGRYQAAQLEFNATPGQWLGDVPLVVLVDGRSASATEVLAGALQDNGRATVVGQNTFGKGSVQSVLAMRNGSALKLTTARYLTPSGRSIHRTGIEPDVPVAPPDDDGDPTLDAALELLREFPPRP